MVGINIFRGNDKQLTEGAINTTARPGAVDPRAQQIDVFPLDAFEFDDPKRIAAPIVRLKSPWQWEVQADVDQVIADVGDQNSASKLTPSSKKELLRQWEMLVETKSGLDIAAGEAGIPGTNDIYEAFVAAYVTVDTYLWTTPGVLISLTTTSTIDYNAYILMWRTMSEAEVALRQLLSAWIRQYGVTRSDTGATVTPTAPTLAVRIMFNSAYLSWSAQPALTGVETARIERSDTADFASHVDVTTVAGHSYTEEGLALNGTDDTPLSRTYYYRVIRISNGVTESILPSNVVPVTAASLSPKAIAANAINASKIAAGSINDMAKFASTIRPPRVVTSIPTTPYTGYENGDTVVLNLLGNADHGKLFRLKDKTQTTTIEVLPALGAWSKAVSGGDIVADSITAGQIAAGAISADEIAANAITASKIVAGARSSPNDPVAYWSMDDVPEIPDDPAGVTYLQDAWATVDGWIGFGGSCAVSVELNNLKLVGTGARAYLQVSKTIAYNAKTYRVKIPADVDIVSVQYYNDAISSYVSMSKYDNGSYYIYDSLVSAVGSTVAQLRINYISTVVAATKTVLIDFIYIGTGAYLPNSLIDNSGNGNHGTIYGATPVDGIGGKALSFDGVNDYCKLYSTILPSSFSISMYISPVLLDPNREIIEKAPPSGQTYEPLRIYIGSTGNLVSFSSDTLTTRAAAELAPAGSFSAGVLKHLVIVRVGSNILAYIDGILVKTTAVTIYDNGNSYLYLGSRITANFFSGTIDEPRIYNRELTEAEIKFLYENKVTTTGMIITDQLVAGAVTADKIFAGAITTDKLAAEAVTAAKIDVADLFALDLEVGNTLRTGERYGTNGAVTDATKSGTYQDLDGTLKIGTPVGEFSVDGATNEAIFKDIPIRSYQGSGVQRRATQLDNDSLDFLDTPDTSPATPEQLRARIGRLGVGPSILFDGDFYAPIQSTWSAGVAVFAETGQRSSQIYTSDGKRRVAYVTSGGVLTEKVYSVGAWSSPATIATGAEVNTVPRYAENTDGSIKIIYATSANAIVERTYTTSWGATTTLVALGYRPEYYKMISGVERLAYSDGGDIREIVKPVGGAWSASALISACDDYSNSSYIEDVDGILHIAYIGYTTTGLVERELSGTWGAESLINSTGTDFPGFYKDLLGNISIQFLAYDGVNFNTYEVYLVDGSWAATPVTVANVAFSSSPALDFDGNINTIYGSSGGSIKETTLRRYAQIGAGIIESGSNSNGSWIKYGDGTMECWGIFPAGTTNIGGPWNTIPFLYLGTVTLPAQFIDTSYSICVSPGQGAYPFPSYHYQVSVSGFSNYIFNAINGAVLAGKWRAVGRWEA